MPPRGFAAIDLVGTDQMVSAQIGQRMEHSVIRSAKDSSEVGLPVKFGRRAVDQILGTPEQMI